MKQGYTQIDNILGQPIPDYILNQLKIRSEQYVKGYTESRSNQALVSAANKGAWVRMVSSVDISGSVNVENLRTYAGSELAQKNVLFGGTSAYEKPVIRVLRISRIRISLLVMKTSG